METAFDDLKFSNDVVEMKGQLSPRSTDFFRQGEAGDVTEVDAELSEAKKNGDDELLSTPLGQRLVTAGIDSEVASSFCEAVLQRDMIKESEVDARVVESIRHYPAAAALAALREFKRCDVSAIENKFGYLFGIMRSWKQRIESGANPEEESSDAVRRGTDDPRIAELLQRTGFKLEIGASQRRYGPPPGWSGEQPGRDCEVYIGRVPKECLEDELVPVLERFGGIFDLRIMLEVSTRESKGYLFVTFQSAESAKRCLEELNGYTLKPGTKPLKTGACSPNTRIYVGNVPKHRSRDELKEDLARVVPGVTEVIVYPCADNPRKKNRGFCFVDFESHRLAGSALKRLEKMATRVWHGSEIYVEWADPIDEVDASALEQVKTVFVNNLSSDVDEAQVRQRFGEFGKIQELKRAKDYAFITFEERNAALHAVETMRNSQLGKNSIGVQLARPLTEKAREMKQQRRKLRDRDRDRDHGRMRDRGDRPRRYDDDHERDSSHSRKYDYDYSGYSRSSSYGGAYPPFPAAPYSPYAPWSAGRPPLPVMPVPFMPVPYPGVPPFGRSSASSSRYSNDRERGRERSREHSHERDRDRERGPMSRSRSVSARPPSTSFGGYPAGPAVGYPPYAVMPVPPHAAFAMPHAMARGDLPGAPRKPLRSTSVGAARMGDRGLKRTAAGVKGGDPTKRTRYDLDTSGKSYYGGGYGAPGAGTFAAAGHAGASSGAPAGAGAGFAYGGFGYGAGGPGARNFADEQFADDNF